MFYFLIKKGIFNIILKQINSKTIKKRIIERFDKHGLCQGHKRMYLLLKQHFITSRTTDAT